MLTRSGMVPERWLPATEFVGSCSTSVASPVSRSIGRGLRRRYVGVIARWRKRSRRLRGRFPRQSRAAPL